MSRETWGLSQVTARTVIAAVTSIRDAVQDCIIEPLGIMRYRAVATPVFRECWMPGTAAPSQLADAPVVTFDRNDDLLEAFLQSNSGRGAATATHFVPTSADFARAITLEVRLGLLPERQCLAPLAEGVVVELTPGHPVDVPLYWQRWNVASSLRPREKAARKRSNRTADGESSAALCGFEKCQDLTHESWIAVRAQVAAPRVHAQLRVRHAL